MIKNFKNIASLFFLLVFIIPSIVKHEHHHAHNEYEAKNDKNNHVFIEKCAICSFEFSVFSSDIENVLLAKKQLLSEYKNNYQSVDCSLYFNFSFLLRAPPILTVLK